MTFKKQVSRISVIFIITALIQLPALAREKPDHSDSLSQFNPQKSSESFERLLETGLNGTLQEFRELLETRIDLNGVDKNGSTVLIWLIVKRLEEKAKLLLVHGANPTIKNDFKQDALFYAIYGASPDLIERLLDYGFDLNSYDNNGISLLMLAAYRGNLLLVRQMVEKYNADIHREDSWGRSAIWYTFAVEKPLTYLPLGIARNPELVEKQLTVFHYLRGLGAKIKPKRNQKNPLFYATTFGFPELVSLFLSEGIAPDSEIERYRIVRGAAFSEYTDTMGLFFKEGWKFSKEQLNEFFRITCSNGNLETLKILVEQGVNPKGAIPREEKLAAVNDSTVESEDIPVLYGAAEKGKVDIVEYLVQAGLNINEKLIYNGMTSLMVATKNGHLATMKSLLKHKANPDLVDVKKRSALQYAIENDSLPAAEVLLTAGADPNMKADDGNPLLNKAIFKGQTDFARLLFKYGADIYSKNRIDRYAICDAIKHNQTAIVGYLLDDGIPLDFEGCRNLPLLHYAVVYGNLATVQLIQERGASLEAHSAEDGYTPLMCGLVYVTSRSLPGKEEWTTGYPGKLFDVLKYLIDQGAQVNAKNFKGETAIMFSIDPAYVLMLIDSGADLDIQDNRGDTALMKSIEQNLPKNVKALLGSGAKIDSQNQLGHTALLIAIEKGYTEITKLLLRFDANVDLQDNKGWSPLHYAVAWNRNEIVEMLLNRKAKVTVTDSYGITPWMISLQNGNQFIQHLISDSHQ